VATLSEEELTSALADSEWQREGDEIARTFDCGTFPKALEFVNEVGRLAEEANHHPDIDIRWKNVTLRLTTHSDNGLTQKDVDLSRRIDALQL
jgi:4a-hydroxytetrahydrobiopterin dehydratase